MVWKKMSLDQPNYFIMPMFIVPYLKLEVKDWENKKKKLLELMNNCNLESDSFLLTSFFDKETTPANQNDLIQSIFEEELSHMKKSFNFNDCLIKESWFQEQTKNMFHPMHHHCGNGVMMSSICYIDYDSSIHSATKFISPYVDSISCSYIDFTPEVTEGTIIFFPSNVLHQTVPSNSDIPRKIVSFNLEVK
jgi:hypothetical protein